MSWSKRTVQKVLALHRADLGSIPEHHWAWPFQKISKTKTKTILQIGMFKFHWTNATDSSDNSLWEGFESLDLDLGGFCLPSMALGIELRALITQGK